MMWALQGTGDAAVTAAKVGSLELQGVCFTYPLRQGRPVLQDLDLTLSRGTVTALVGRRCNPSQQLLLKFPIKGI